MGLLTLMDGNRLDVAACGGNGFSHAHERQRVVPNLPDTNVVPELILIKHIVSEFFSVSSILGLQGCVLLLHCKKYFRAEFASHVQACDCSRTTSSSFFSFSPLPLGSAPLPYPLAFLCVPFPSPLPFHLPPTSPAASSHAARPPINNPTKNRKQACERYASLPSHTFHSGLTAPSTRLLA